MKIESRVTRPHLLLWVATTVTLYILVLIFLQQALPAAIPIAEISFYSASITALIVVCAITWPLLLPPSRINVLVAQITVPVIMLLQPFRCDGIGCFFFVAFLVFVAVASIFSIALIQTGRLIFHLGTKFGRLSSIVLGVILGILPPIFIIILYRLIFLLLNGQDGIPTKVWMPLSVLVVLVSLLSYPIAYIIVKKEEEIL